MIWLDGSFRDAADARIAPDDRGFTLADGVFETVRLEHGRACHVGRHLRRLRAAAALLRIPLRWDDAVLAGVFAALAHRHAPAGAGVARLTLTRGPAPRGLLPIGSSRPTTIVTAQSGIPPADPVSVVIASTTRRNEHSPLSRIKSLNYGDGVLARLEAADQKAGDALLRNGAGLVCEATAATVIVLRGNRLLTPRVADGALPGIRRALLVERADVMEAAIDDDVLAGADAVILGNSLGVRAVAAIDLRAVGIRPDLVERLRRLTEADDEPMAP